MEYIKKHKLTAFIILVYIIVIGFGFFIYNLFIGSSGLPVYGDRLDGIENVPITDEQKNTIVANLEKENNVIKVTEPYLTGKIFKVVITVTDDIDLAPGKKLADKVIEPLTDEQKEFYDVEVFIRKNYNCTLEATGKVDEDGNFVDDVKVKFLNDLSKVEGALDYGIMSKDSKEYNKEQNLTITEDGDHIVYGFVKDKASEYKCSIKVVKKSGEDSTESSTINSITTRSYPIIAYRKQGVNSSFVWTKDR